MFAEELVQLIERSEDMDNLQSLREEIENDLPMDADDRRTINTAIDNRCSFLNALHFSKQQPQQP